MSKQGVFLGAAAIIASSLIVKIADDKVDENVAKAKVEKATVMESIFKRTDSGYYPAEAVYRPLMYTDSTKRYQITIVEKSTDTVLAVLSIQSDSTGLLDVTARIQPSQPPKDIIIDSLPGEIIE